MSSDTHTRTHSHAHTHTHIHTLTHTQACFDFPTCKFFKSTAIKCNMNQWKGEIELNRKLLPLGSGQPLHPQIYLNTGGTLEKTPQAARARMGRQVSAQSGLSQGRPCSPLVDTLWNCSRLCILKKLQWPETLTKVLHKGQARSLLRKWCLVSFWGTLPPQLLDMRLRKTQGWISNWVLLNDLHLY